MTDASVIISLNLIETDLKVVFLNQCLKQKMLRSLAPNVTMPTEQLDLLHGI